MTILDKAASLVDIGGQPIMSMVLATVLTNDEFNKVYTYMLAVYQMMQGDNSGLIRLEHAHNNMPGITREDVQDFLNSLQQQPTKH
jgi:chromosome segregation and condensation protein ScpB